MCYKVCVVRYFTDSINTTLTNLPESVSCAINNKWTQFHCCVDLNFKIIRASVHLYLKIDNCNYVISVGFGEWRLNRSLFTYMWGTEEMHTLGNAIGLRSVPIGSESLNHNGSFFHSFYIMTFSVIMVFLSTCYYCYGYAYTVS